MKTKRRIINKKKTKKRVIGGRVKRWYISSEIKPEEECAICVKSFEETPSEIIFKTDCGHLFHNNCLNQHCNYSKNSTQKCPLCRRNITNDCTNVWNFKHMKMDNYSFTNPAVKQIYDAQLIEIMSDVD
jgi:hypothetical protein